MTIADDELNDHVVFYEPWQDEEQSCTSPAKSRVCLNGSGSSATDKNCAGAIPSSGATPPQPDPLVDALESQFAQLPTLHNADDDFDRQFVEHKLRVLASLEDEIERIRSWSTQQIERLSKSHDRYLDWNQSKIAEAVGRIIAGQKKRSYSTPWGTAGFRKRVNPRIEFGDKDAVVGWCRDHWPTALTYSLPETRVLKQELYKAFLAGKHPPVSIEGPGETFYVKTSTQHEKAPASVAVVEESEE